MARYKTVEACENRDWNSSGTRSWWSKTTRAKRAKGQGDEEQEIGRVAGVHGINRTPPADLHRQPQRVPERQSVLAEIACRAARGRAQRIAQDSDTVDHLLNGVVTVGSGRTNHRNREACLRQGAALLPDPTVERHRKVLDQNRSVLSDADKLYPRGSPPPSMLGSDLG